MCGVIVSRLLPLLLIFVRGSLAQEAGSAVIFKNSSSTNFRVCSKSPEKFPYIEHGPIQHKLGEDSDRTKNFTEILQSTQFPPKVELVPNGFIHTVLLAYDGHHNLAIRPDDVWAAIMIQFSFYVNANTEEFRGKFVNFTGKKQLRVFMTGSLRSVPYDYMVNLFTEKIQENLVDPKVGKWILPNFSTTTSNDIVTTGVIFMATLKNYFDYRTDILCGIPHVSLEGTVEDWKNVQGRLEKLKEYGLEGWYHMLNNILQQFVNAKQGNVDLNFWQEIVHYKGSGGCGGPPIVSGWITAFALFNNQGKWQEAASYLPKRYLDNPKSELSSGHETKWLEIPMEDIPTSVVQVDVKITDNGEEHSATMFAGHMGTEIKPDGITLQPVLGWMIALKPDNNSGIVPALSGSPLKALVRALCLCLLTSQIFVNSWLL